MKPAKEAQNILRRPVIGAAAVLAAILLLIPFAHAQVGEKANGAIALSPRNGQNTSCADAVPNGHSETNRSMLEAVEDHYRSALEADPTSVDATVCLAETLAQEKQDAASLYYWKKAVALSPEDESHEVDLAVSYLNNRQPKAAADVLERVLAKDKDNGAAILDLGTAYARIGEYQYAADQFFKATKFPQLRATAELSLIKSLVTLLEYSKAKPWVDQYVAGHPSDYEGLYLAGLVYFRLGLTQQAIVELNRALTLRPHSFEAFYLLGSSELKAGESAKAVEDLAAAGRIRPDSRKVHYQLLKIYRAEGESAKVQQEAALLRAEDDAQARNTRAVVAGIAARASVAAGKYQDAIKEYKRVLDLVSTNEDRANTLYDLALVYDKLGERMTEREVLERAVREDPGVADVHGQLGFLDLSSGDEEAAKQQFALALQINPQSVEALGNLGILYAHEGRFSDAERVLRLATEINPKYGRGYLNLGLLLAAQGHYLEAERMLRKDLALRPGDAPAVHALQLIEQKHHTSESETLTGRQ